MEQVGLDLLMKGQEALPQRFFTWRNLDCWSSLTQAAMSHPTRCAISRVLKARFEGISVYHGARPIEVASYYRDGLRLPNHSALESDARAIFLNDRFRHVTEAQLMAEVVELRDHSEGQVYVCLDPLHLVENAAHYMIYGSETLQGIAGSFDGREELSRRGRPTMFHVELPWSLVDAQTMDELVGAIEEEVDRVMEDASVPETFCSFALSTAIPPECLVRYAHPHKLWDLHTQDWCFDPGQGSMKCKSSR